jgi:hypothetical protein
MAWGSGSANFPYLVTPDSALQSQALADGSVYQSILGTSASRQISLPWIYKSYEEFISILTPIWLIISLSFVESSLDPYAD